ncbi:MAG: hypothetical protein WBO88_12895 [Candidatus Dechloromonas phosphoritropha]
MKEGLTKGQSETTPTEPPRFRDMIWTVLGLSLLIYVGIDLMIGSGSRTSEYREYMVSRSTVSPLKPNPSHGIPDNARTNLNNVELGASLAPEAAPESAHTKPAGALAGESVTSNLGVGPATASPEKAEPGTAHTAAGVARESSKPGDW